MRLDISGVISAQNPSWNNYGTEICLTDWRGGYNKPPARVLKYNLATKIITIIADGKGITNCSQPGNCWHPTSGIIFSSDRWGDDGDQICRWKPGFLVPEIASLSSLKEQPGVIERLTHTRGYVGYEPTWAPDGIWFAYEQHKKDQEKHGQIVRVLTPLTDPLFDCRQPCWSWDGNLIVYQCLFQGNWWLYIMRPNGTGTRRLVKGTDATWHPDNKQILYSDNDGKLALLELATFLSIPVGPRHGYHGAPSVSPNGKQIICEAFDRDPDNGPGTWLEIFDI